MFTLLNAHAANLERPSLFMSLTPAHLNMRLEIDKELPSQLEAVSKQRARVVFEDAIETWRSENVQLAKARQFAEQSSRTAKELAAVDKELASLARALESDLNDGIDSVAAEQKATEARAKKETLRLRKETLDRLMSDAKRLAQVQLRQGLTELKASHVAALKAETDKAAQELASAVQKTWPAFQAAAGAAGVIHVNLHLVEELVQEATSATDVFAIPSTPSNPSAKDNPWSEEDELIATLHK